MSRRRNAHVPEDPTLAEDLLGVPADTIDNAARTPAGDDEELGRLLADRAPRAHLPWVTATLVGAILLSAGYVAGGYHYRNSGSGGASATGLGAARTTGARGAEGGFGGFGAGTGTTTGGTGTGAALTGGATIGTVKLVDGNNVYLTTTAGATVKVALAKGATVTVTKKGALSDLAPGTTVVVVGQTASDGTVNATAVTEGGGGFGARAGG